MKKRTLLRTLLAISSSLLLAGCSLSISIAGDSSSSSSSSANNASIVQDTTSNSSSSSETNTDTYFYKIAQGSDFDTVCTTLEQYIDLFDSHLFLEDKNFSITYSFSSPDIDTIEERTSYWDIQETGSYSRSTLSQNEYKDTYSFTYNDYATGDSGTVGNATETLGVLDDMFLNEGTSRSSSFTDFPINNRENSISVSNSDQLYYAVSRGYKPECVSGSSAEKMYTAAEDVCRKYISDSDTDLTKVEKIFSWLGNDIQYDNAALNADLDNAYVEDCYYLEGIFNRHIAVCDGMAKAFALLCGIENIPAVRVTGTVKGESSDSGHAWDYVRINGTWYGACPTSNNAELTVSDDDSSSSETSSTSGTTYEIAEKDLFLISKANMDTYYTQDSYPFMDAPADYGFFENTTISFDNETHSLVATTQSDIDFFLNLLMNYSSTTYRFLTFRLSFGDTTEDRAALNNAVNNYRFTSDCVYGMTSKGDAIILTL